MSYIWIFSAVAFFMLLTASINYMNLTTARSARRAKEIGIRKILGASVKDVVFLLAKHFIGLVLIANLIAWPLACVAMRGWLSSFDQKIGLSPAYFLGAAALTLLIAVLITARV